MWILLVVITALNDGVGLSSEHIQVSSKSACTNLGKQIESDFATGLTLRTEYKVKWQCYEVK